MWEKRTRFEQVWANPLTAVVLCSLGTFAAIWSHCKPLPLPGVAVAIMGSMAAVMSLRQAMKGWEKAWWMLLMAFLLSAELRAIRYDREKSNSDQQRVRDEQNRRFDAIANGLKTSANLGTRQFASTITHVDDVLEKTQQVAGTAQESLSEITGGNSYAWLQVAHVRGEVAGLAIAHKGNHPLRNLSFRVVDLDAFYSAVKEKERITLELLAPSQREFTIGDLGKGQMRLMPDANLSLKPINRFNVFFIAMNGAWTEQLRVRRSPDGIISTALRVFRGSKPDHPLFQTIDPDYPRGKDGRIDWD